MTKTHSAHTQRRTAMMASEKVTLAFSGPRYPGNISGVGRQNTVEQRHYRQQPKQAGRLPQ